MPSVVRVLPVLLYALGFDLLVMGYYWLASRGTEGLTSVACQWDCGWYHGIFDLGYPPAGALNHDGQASWAFFPLFPLAALGVSHLLHQPFVAASLILNNAALVVMTVICVGYMRRRYGVRDPWLTVAVFMTLPTTLYFRVPYSEALFGLLAAAVIALFAERRILAAGLCAAVFTACRPTASLLVAIVAVSGWLGLWWSVLRRRAAADQARLRESLRIAAFAALGTIGLLSYMIYLHVHAGDALAFVHVESGWHRRMDDPIGNILRAFRFDDLTVHNFLDRSDRSARYVALEGIAGGLGVLLALALGCWLEAVLLFAIWWVSGSSGLESIQRYMFANPMMMVVIAVGLARVPRAFVWPAITVFAMLQALLVPLWFAGKAFLT